MGHYKDLRDYQKAYELAMKIFHVSKKFPPEEKYSLTDQIDDRPGLYVPTWQKHIKGKDIKIILSANSMIPKL